VSEASRLKQQVTGDIIVAGSFQLLHPLLEHDLVDELRLMIYPVVLGIGKRLFACGASCDRQVFPRKFCSTSQSKCSISRVESCHQNRFIGLPSALAPHAGAM
jgi:dihydrofolate reductase